MPKLVEILEKHVDTTYMHESEKDAIHDAMTEYANWKVDEYAKLKEQQDAKQKKAANQATLY